MMEGNEKEKNQYQIAGLDNRERGFNRLAEVIGENGNYQAILRYETARFLTGLFSTERDALQELISVLHKQGFRQLRSQLTFQGNSYLGTQPEWVEYQDPKNALWKVLGFSKWVKKLFRFGNPESPP